MLKVYKLFRDIISWLFLVIVTALVGEFAIDLAKEHGYFEHPTKTFEAVMSLLVQIKALEFFWPTLTGVGGLVLGMWLDSLALRHLRKEKAPTKTNTSPEMSLTPKQKKTLIFFCMSFQQNWAGSIIN
jgi:hypothetical protein